MKKVLALLLALCLMLALVGCGSQDAADPEGEVTDSPAPTQSEAPSAGDLELFPDNAEDLTQTLLGFPSDTALMTVNGVEVTAEEYLYWLGNIVAQYDNMYSYYGMELDLTAELEEGVTWDQRFKEVAYQNAVLLAIIPDLAAANGVALTDEDMAEIAQEHADSVEELGAEMYAYQLQVMNLNDRTAYHMDQMSMLYTKVREALAQKLAEDVTAEEVAEYVEENDLLRAKHILLLTVDTSSGEAYDEDTIADQKAKAEDILAQLKEGADFDALMNEYSEDGGLVTNPDGYLFTAGDMVSEFEDETRALEIGQMSQELVESYYGYHIIWRLDPDCQEVREELADDRVNDTLQSAVDGATVETAPEYDTFTAADYYYSVLEYQENNPAPDSEEGN